MIDIVGSVLLLGFIKNQHRDKQWLAGLIIKKSGPVSYQVKLEDGKVVRCRQDQLRPRFTDINVESQEAPLLNDDDLTIFTNIPPSLAQTLLVHIWRDAILSECIDLPFDTEKTTLKEEEV